MCVCKFGAQFFPQNVEISPNLVALTVIVTDDA
jgi:hypothetical protein